MDQNAFRSLLTAPRENAAASSSTSTVKKSLGGPAPKRGWGIKPKDNKAYEKPKETEVDAEKPAFAPRLTAKKILHDGGYKDRAEMRRKGVDDEYREVEKMLEDFEKKARESGVEEEEKQRAYLGGDAEHSILVKGLDFALLAARKAELAKHGDEVADEELEALAKGLKPKLKKSAERGTERESGGDVEGLGKGFKAIAKPKEVKAEKKKKKKKKLDVSPAQAGASDSRPPGTAAGPSSPPKPPPLAEKASALTASALHLAFVPTDDGEDDFNIFADAGEYELGGDEGSDEDDDGREPVAATSREITRDREVAWDERGGRSRSRSRGSPVMSDGGRRHGDQAGRYQPRERYVEHEYERDRLQSRTRSRSRSRSRSRDRVLYKRDERSPRRSYGRQHDDYDRDYTRNRGGSRSRDHDGDRQSYKRPRTYSRSPSRSPPRRRRYDSPPSRGFRSRSPDEYRWRQSGGYDERTHIGRDPRYARPLSRSPSPLPRQQHKVDNRRASSMRHGPILTSPSPPPAPSRNPPRARSRSRSPTSPLFAHLDHPTYSRSPSPSSSQDDGPIIPTKLVPLQGSAISDLKSFLAHDADAAKSEEKRLRKAMWRAKQGGGAPEGVDTDVLERKKKEGAEKGRANADYVKVMGMMQKDGTSSAKE